MPAGTIRFALHNALPHAAIRLVQARVAWPDASRSEGWGRDEDMDRAARKALSEAVERAAWRRLPASAAEATQAQLASPLAPESLVRYEPAQYRRPGFPFRPGRPGERRCWLPARSVLDGEERMVPADAVCHPLAFEPSYRRRLLTWATSSGCASGEHLADAIVRATLELIERDAFMRHWFAQAPGQGLRSASLPQAAAARLNRLRAAGCDAGVQCLTRGLHPAWLAWAQHPRRYFSCVGAGCALDAEQALASALGELETQAWAHLEGVPARRIAAGAVRTPADHAALYATRHGFRHADRVLRAPPCEDFRALAPAFQLTPQALQERLQQAGHAACWVDLSLPDAADILGGAPLYTVRVLAPGLIPIAFGHGLLPLGMAPQLAPGGRLPHPFA